MGQHLSCTNTSVVYAEVSAGRCPRLEGCGSFEHAEMTSQWMKIPGGSGISAMSPKAEKSRGAWLESRGGRNVLCLGLDT